MWYMMFVADRHGEQRSGLIVKRNAWPESPVWIPRVLRRVRVEGRVFIDDLVAVHGVAFSANSNDPPPVGFVVQVAGLQVLWPIASSLVNERLDGPVAEHLSAAARAAAMAWDDRLRTHRLVVRSAYGAFESDVSGWFVSDDGEVRLTISTGDRPIGRLPTHVCIPPGSTPDEGLVIDTRGRPLKATIAFTAK